MTILGINAAARAASVARSTIQRAIKTGRLSAVSTATGERSIDLAELLRVFGPLPQTRPERAAALPPAAASDATGEATLVGVLQDQLQQALERERQAIDRAQERESRLLALLETEQQARRELEIKLLPAPKAKVTQNNRVWIRLAVLLVVLAALIAILIRPELVGRLIGD